MVRIVKTSGRQTGIDMIRGYGDKRTERFAGGEFIAAFQRFERAGGETAFDPERGAFAGHS